MKKLIILIFLIFPFIIGCGTTSSVLNDISLKMLKKEVKETIGDPTVVRGAIVNKYNQNVEVWEYRLYRYSGAVEGLSNEYDLYWLYFVDGFLYQWGKAGDWAKEADKIYEFRFK